MTLAEMREEAFKNACALKTDINEHLPTLRRLASECEHVTEMGLRTGMSTLALLAGQPKTLISWDIDPRAVLSQHCVVMSQLSEKTSFQPRVGDTRLVTIEHTDMLFIDTLHTFEQLKAELIRHVLFDHFAPKPRVSKYLVFHDTSTFGFEGEDKKVPGLLGAIHWFQQQAFPVWHTVEQHLNNNGLTVLQRFP